MDHGFESQTLEADHAQTSALTPPIDATNVTLAPPIGEADPPNTKAKKGRPTNEHAAINKQRSLELAQKKTAANPPTRFSTRTTANKNS